MDNSKIPPQNLEAEQSTLGSMMIEQNALNKGFEILRSEDFYRPAHQEIFDSLQSLARRNEPVDIITLQEELRKRGKLEEVGSTEYLMALVDTVPTAANLEHYAKIVAHKSLLRQLIAGATEIIGIAHSDEIENPEEEAMSIISRIGNGKSSDVQDIKEILDEVHAQWRAYERGDKENGIKWRPNSLNRIVRPLLKGKLVVIGADTSHGKSVMLQEVIEATCDAKGAALMFTYEMTAQEVVSRIMCSKSHTDIYQLEEGIIDWECVTKYFGHCYEYNLKVTDYPRSIETLCSIARSWNDKHKHIENRVVVVDYSQLVYSDKNTRDVNELVSTVMKSLKLLSKQLKCTVVTASQLRKGVQGSNVWAYSDNINEVKFPRLDDLIGASEIKNSADTVLMLVNPPDEPIDFAGRRKAYVKNAKERGGRAGGKKELWYYPSYTRFEDYTDY